MNTFHERLQTVMKHYGMTARALAERCDLTESHVSRYINGHVKPGSDTLAKISATLPALNVAWLLHGKGDMLTTQPKETKP